MSATQTIRPNADTSLTGWVKTPNTTTASDKLSDNSDSTYITASGVGGGGTGTLYGTETFTAADGSAPANYTLAAADFGVPGTGGRRDIRSNALSMVTGNGAAYNNYATGILTAAATIVSDSIITFRFQMPTDEQFIHFAIRGDGTWFNTIDVNAGFVLRIEPSYGNWFFGINSGGTFTQQGSGSIAWTTGSWYKVKLSAIAGVVGFKIWLDGTTEPGTWTFTESGQSYTTAGRFMFRNGNGGASQNATLNIDDVLVTNATGTGSAAIAQLDYTSYTLLATERCAGVTVRLKDFGTLDSNVTHELSTGAEALVSAGVNQTTPPSTPTYRTGSTQVLSPAGAEWTQARIDAFYTKSTYVSGAASGSIRNLVELAADLLVLTKPSCAVTSPANNSTGTPTLPSITWTYTGNGEAQTRYDVKIYTITQVNAGGFDPNTTTPTYRGGTAAASTTHQVITPLSSGVAYRVYVAVAKDFNGVDWWSDWASSNFTTSNNPAVIVTQPAGTITTSSSLDVKWTFSGPAAQDHYWVKIFAAAVYTAPGFDPETATSIYDSLEQFGSTKTHTVTKFLDDGIYRAYVKAGTTSGGSTTYSPWASMGFVLFLGRPATPTVLSVTPDVTLGRLVIVVQGRDNLLDTNTASFVTTVGQWSVPTNATLTRSTTKFIDDGSLRLSATTAATMAAATNAGLTGIPVLPNFQYTASAFVVSGTTLRSVQISILWYNAAGTLVQTDASTAVAEQSTTFPGSQFIITATSPATAAYAAIKITVLSPGSGELHYVDRAYFGPGFTTAWTRGGLRLATKAVLFYFEEGGSADLPTGHSDAQQPDDVRSQMYTFYDYEAPPGAPRSYIAYVYANTVNAV